MWQSITISDEVIRLANACAALEGLTLTEWVEAALKQQAQHDLEHATDELSLKS